MRQRRSNVPRRTSRGEDLMTMVFALWTLGGLLVDAYFHSTDPGLESFWTPWHALFYSGFTATAAWLVYLTLKRAKPPEDGGAGFFLTNALDWAPTGYRPALIGLVVFAAGGVGDAVWHTVFGVEVGLDALLSPTHLVLFVGLLMITLAPLRAAWADPEDRPTFVSFLPAMLSLLITTTVIAFFFQYVWAVTETWLVRVEFDPNDGFSQTVAALAVMGVIVSTLIMFTPILLTARRWTLPFGVATIVATAVSVFIAVGFDEDPVAIPAVLLAGLTFDGLLRIKANWRLVAAIPPMVLWIAYFIIIERRGDLGLAPEIWGGAIVFSALAMLVVEFLISFRPHEAGPARVLVLE